MSETEKRYAVITGASKGIGRSIAHSLAKRGFNLLLIARSVDELQKLKSELSTTYKVDIDIFIIDLSIADAPKQIFDWISVNGYHINILINNAGYGLWGAFTALNLESQMEMCKLNMDAMVKLSHLLLPKLLLEKQAYLLNVASTAAYQALPTFAIYAATKAFVLSFTRALRYEMKDTPVSVSCISPGPVDTAFASRAGLDPFSKMAQKFNMQPNEVAEIAVKGMLAKKAEIIPGFANSISAFATRLLPKFLIEHMAASIYKT